MPDPTQPDPAFQELFHLSPDAIFIEDYEGNVLDANDEALRLHRMTRQDLVGRNVVDLVPIEAREKTLREFQRWVTGEMTQYKGLSRTASGDQVPVEIRARRVSYLGTPALLFHVRDITEYQQSEHALRESRERYRQLLEQLHEGVWTLDANGVSTYVNPQLTRLLDRTGPEVLGKTIREFVHVSDALQALSPTHILEALVRQPVEVLLCSKTGKAVPALISGSVMDAPHASADRYLLSVTDLTENRNLQLQLFQAQKMEAFGRMLGGVAHDFNNLLTAIIGQADYIRQQIPPDSVLREETDRLLAASERATRMVRQMLMFSRKDTASSEVLDVADLARHVRAMVLRVLPSGLAFPEVVADTPVFIRVNPGHLEQILMNLLINARDATGDGGRIEVQVRERTARKEEFCQFVGQVPPTGTRMCCLEVRDTGTGIAPEHLGQIFEPFFSTKSKEDGTGLGLSTVYSMVIRHRGFIAVETKPGAGTCFKLFFTLADPVHAALPPHPPQNPPRSRLILLVDDDPAVRKVTAQMLRHCEYEVETAEGPQAALERVKRATPGEFAAVVSDILMPEIDGVAMSRAIRKQFSALPVLFITGCGTAQVEEYGPLPSGTAVLHKPFRLRELRDALALLCEGAAALSRVSVPGPDPTSAP